MKVRMQLPQVLLLVLPLVARSVNGGNVPDLSNVARVVNGGNLPDFSNVEFAPKVSLTRRRGGESEEGKCTLEMFSNNSAAYWACR